MDHRLKSGESRLLLDRLQSYLLALLEALEMSIHFGHWLENGLLGTHCVMRDDLLP